MNEKRKGCRILVCEDEMLVAMMLHDRLEKEGYDVLMAARVAPAVQLAEREIVDAALLDINLAGEDSYPVAAALRQRGIPFLFSSGYGAEHLPEPWGDVDVLRKPYDLQTVVAAVQSKLDTPV